MFCFLWIFIRSQDDFQRRLKARSTGPAATKAVLQHLVGLRMAREQEASGAWRYISTEFCLGRHRIQMKGPCPVGRRAGISLVVSFIDPGLN